MNNTNFLKTLVLWLILGLILILVFNVFSSSNKKEISKIVFSQFISDVQSGKVAEVVIRGHNIKGKYKGQGRFETYAPDDDDLIKLLRENDVMIEAKPEDENFWLQNFLIYWGPLIILLVIWIYFIRFIRQIQGNEAKALSFGKSKAKMLNASSVDTIIEVDGGIVLIKRKDPPLGWAIPGGFVEYGETLEDAAIREARKETGLEITLVRQFHTYSEPGRDPRHHTISTVFIARAKGVPIASDDVNEDGIFKDMDSLPDEIAFDHRKILEDFFRDRY